jgi:hypothetical protein
MKKLVMSFTLFLVAFAILLIVSLSVQYSPTYVYRLISMHVADIYDYQFFPNRSIEGRELASQFESKSKEQFIESLFEKRHGVSGFNSFDDWVSGSETTSLIVIQKDEIIYEKYFNGFTKAC